MRYLLPLFLILLVSCGGGEEINEFDPPQGYESRSGIKIYQRHCEKCHGPDGKMQKGGASDLSISKMDSTSVVKILKNGQNGMPRQMQHIKSDQELDNLIEHLKSLRK